MLYVFHVDTGTMLTFDMNLAMESVSMLQAMIEKMCRIPKDKQVLLISGGENLNPNSRVCSYSAGTDTNPIYLFSKSSIEAATPPNASVNYGSETDLRDQVEGSLNMPPSYETVVARAQLALQFHDVAKEELRMCEYLVHDQHLQHQGWAAVIANLEDITSAFWSRIDVFKKNVHSYLSSRDNYLEILASFSEAIQLLGKIPVLPCLLSGVPREVEECQEELSVATSSKTLLNWISAQDSRSSLEQMAQQCLSNLHQFDEKVKESLLTEAQTLLDAINNPSMKEVKGLEDRLFGLEQLMFGAKKIVQEQGEMAQGFVQNENRARNLADVSVLPDLCNSHRHQLVVLLKNHQNLHDIRRRCMLAKEELSINLHTRLRWVMYIEKSICDIDGKLVIHHETLKKLKRRLEIIQQTYDAPVVYARAVHEVVRRRLFATQFLEWANNLAGKSSHMHHKEIVKRKQFAAYMKHHFLQALFPGFEDSPPPFAVKSPEPFDMHLPAIQREDLDYLRHEVPQLAPHLLLDEDIDLMRLVGMTKHTVDVAVPCEVTQTDELTTSEIVILQPESDTDEGIPDNPFYNSRMQALPLLSLAGQLREHVARGDDPIARGSDSIARGDDHVARGGDTVAKDDCTDCTQKDTTGTQTLSDEHNYDVSQSVEVLETEGSTDDDTTTQQMSQKTGDTVRSLEDDTQQTHETDTTSSPMPERRHLDSGHSGASAEFEECSSAAFMTADFFIDESLPSSMAESAATKKVIELQMALQEKVLCLETKERELEEKRQLVDCMKPRLANMQANFTTLKGMVENGTHGLRCDIRDMQKDVQAEKDEFRMFVECATHQLMTAIADFETEKERQREELMDEVRNQHTQEKSHLEAQLTTANKKVETTQQELELTERRMKEVQEEYEHIRQTADARIAELKEEFVVELQQTKSELMLEHEVELEKTVNDMRLELEERDRQVEEAQSLAETQLTENTALVARCEQIADSLRAAFEEEKAEILKAHEASLVERLAEVERTLQETLRETRCKEMETLRSEKNEAVKNAIVETSKELTMLHDQALETLRSQLAEEQAKRLAQVTEEMKVEKEKELNVLRESLAELHQVELHDLEQRLQLSHQEALTKRVESAAEAHQVELNKRAEEHERTVAKLRDELGSERESEMVKLKEQFELEKKELLQQQQRLEQQHLEQQQQVQQQQQVEQQEQVEQEQQQEMQQEPPADGEKTECVGVRDVGDDGDAAGVKATFEEEKRRAVEEVLEAERQRHETELMEHTLRLKKDIAALKASLIAEKQVKFNEALNKVVVEKNEVIERLKERESELLREKERDEAIISQLRSSGGRSDRPTDVSEARLIQQTLEAELASARQGRLQMESELRDMRQSSQAAALSQSVFTSPVMAESVVTVPGGASMTQSVVTGSLEDCVTELRQSIQSKDLQLVGLQHKVMELSMTASSRSFVQNKVSITTCNPGDLVLLCLDEQHDHYVVFTVGTTLHFLHSECLDALALRTGPGEPRKSWVLAEIVDKEYCQAKKAQNRFKVPVGTKFYRVKAVPWKNRQGTPQTTPQQKEQQKGT